MNEGEIMQYQTISYGEGKEKIELTLLDNLMEQKLGGMISSPMFSENIAIVVEDNPETIDYDFACLGYAKEKTAPRVMMKSEFFDDLKRATSESRTILFHEIGHYFNNDILTNEGNSDEEREKLVLNNKVSEKEVSADAFAVKYLGKDVVIDGLRNLKQRIFTEFDEYDGLLSAMEIDMRISKIDKMR